jgi:hypothetical protein
MKTIYSPDGSESRIIHDVDYPGYQGLGWSDIKPVDPPALDEPDVEPLPDEPDALPDYELPSDDSDDLGYTAEDIQALTWRQQRALLSPKEQAEKPENLSWEEWAISLLVEVAEDE